MTFDVKLLAPVLQPENVFQEANAISDSVFDVTDVPLPDHNSSLDEGKILKSEISFSTFSLSHN